MFVFNTLFLQRVLGYSALEAGLAFRPFTAGIIIGATASQQLIPRADKRGRIAALEILINTPAVSNLIRQGKLDQLENAILPALRAGFIVLADRYIYTLMARDLVRGVDPAWLRNLYGIALVPDAVFYLDVAPAHLVQRVFAKSPALDYWESGMDLGLSRDLFDSFLKYQALMREAFRQLQCDYGFHIVDGERDPVAVGDELTEKIAAVLVGK